MRPLATSWPLRSGLCGGSNETFHFGEVGWLSDDASYGAVRDAIASLPLTFELLDLNAMRVEPPTPPHGMHVVFISNADQSAKFLQHGRRGLEQALGGQGRMLLVSTLAVSHVHGVSVDTIAERSLIEEKSTLLRAPNESSAQLAALKALRHHELRLYLE